jgi:hypothetical protein
MPDPALEDLLADHRSLASRRAATEPGTRERTELETKLLAVQRQIRYWSDDEHEDGEVEQNGG